MDGLLLLLRAITSETGSIRTTCLGLLLLLHSSYLVTNECIGDFCKQWKVLILQHFGHCNNECMNEIQMLFTYLAFGFVAPLSILLCLIVLLWGWKFITVWFRGGVWLKQALRQGHSVAILLIWLCESTSIDKDAMALKVFQHIIIFLFTFVKYTCPREKNSKSLSAYLLVANEQIRQKNSEISKRSISCILRTLLTGKIIFFILFRI